MTADQARQAIGIALPPAHSVVLSRALTARGFTCEIAATPALIQAVLREGHCRAWIFDDSSDEGLEALACSGAALLPVESLPDSQDATALHHWCEGVVTWLESLASPSVGADVSAVWLLAGSSGAAPAVQAFLNALPEPPPVALLYAQHFDVDREVLLGELAPENPAFTMSLLESRTPLTAGSVIIVSPSCRFTLAPGAVVALAGQPWGAHHAPDISEVIRELTRSALTDTGVILFSGMGTDGSEALADYTAAGGIAWAQDPDDAICGAMPAAAIATGCVSRVATPSALAAALRRRYPG